MGKKRAFPFLSATIFSATEYCGNTLENTERKMDQTSGLVSTDMLFYTTNRALAAIGNTLFINYSHNVA